MKTKYKKNKKKRNVTIKRKHVSTRRRQRGGGHITNIDIDESNEFAVRDGATYNIQEVADSYTFEGKAVAIVSFQTCGMNCENPPTVTYRALEGIMTIHDGNGNTYETYEGTFDENGNKKDGKLIKSVPNGSTYKKTTYTGHFEDGNMSDGKMVLEDGSIYTGNFIDNNFNGKGELKAADGSVYTGEFKDDLFHGEGTLKSISGDIIFSGQWKDGTMHNGTGRYTMPNGDVYNGNFQNGKRHGEGIMYYEDGSVYNGHFENGNRHGEGKMYYKDGSRRYEGTWKNGKMFNGKLYKPGRTAAYTYYTNGISRKL